ncbi:hypothetical protein QVD17_07976 [Tagetes erecta]|uniref:Jacalin-type lectin domain-containing protein n=1 Tax=Tagetes erecta TaxID=13708 RepID=A0AAD8L2A1_TARER|nr:hypothetical protein QVD17_07976 [Tagetes erecta]
MTGVLTKASNVYAFGVVLWEVLCGRPAVLQECNDERKFLSTLVECHYKHRNLEKILFANIKKDMKPYSLERITGIAYRCLSNDRGDRSTMEIVVKELQAALEHQIGKQTMLWGSTSGGDPWSFKVNKNQKLTKITIDYHTWIHAISFTKKDLDGTLHYSETNGGRRDNNAGKIFEVNFDDDEEITGISGTVGSYYGHKLVSSLCIVTTKGKYGPFGYQTRISFSKSWEVGFFGGFFGRSGWELDAIGCVLNGSAYITIIARGLGVHSLTPELWASRLGRRLQASEFGLLTSKVFVVLFEDMDATYIKCVAY